MQAYLEQQVDGYKDTAPDDGRLHGSLLGERLRLIDVCKQHEKTKTFTRQPTDRRGREEGA